ncbi:hypothetical protein JCM19046_131 [Bacillus sp. JCM 19046]|nr:hypothetical protein JCM19045_4439 [Bacillus sp. JCM 19045]GAF15735.1 hypothetical protein JCM19046_131 [Bacillus sp. JCM 19046]
MMTIEVNILTLLIGGVVFLAALFVVVEKAVQRGVDASRLRDQVEAYMEDERKK